MLVHKLQNCEETVKKSLLLGNASKEADLG